MLKLKICSILEQELNCLSNYNEEDGCLDNIDEDEANVSISHNESDGAAVIFKKEYFKTKSISHEHKSPLTTKKGI